MKTIATLLALTLLGCAHAPVRTQLDKNLEVCKAQLETFLKVRGSDAKVLSCSFNKDQQRVNCIVDDGGEKHGLGRYVTPEGSCE